MLHWINKLQQTMIIQTDYLYVELILFGWLVFFLLLAQVSCSESANYLYSFDFLWFFFMILRSCSVVDRLNTVSTT